MYNARIHSLLLAMAVSISCLPAVFAGTTPAGGSSSRETPEELLRAGRAALEDGLYDLAGDRLGRYLKSVDGGTPEHDAGTVLLARVFHGQRRYKDMLRLLSPPRNGAFLFWHAMAFYELKQYDKVLADLGVFKEKYGGSEYADRACRLKSKCLLETGKTGEALETFALFEQTYTNSPERLSSLLDWSKTLTARGDTAGARGVLERLISLSFGSAEGQEARELLGRILVREKQWKLAETVLYPLATDKEGSEEYRIAAWFSLAKVYEAQDRFAEATNMLHRGIAQAEDAEMKEKGTISLGRLLLKAKRLDEGIALLKPMITAEPEEAVARTLQLEIADALLDAGEAKRAVDEYQCYLETYSDDAGRMGALSGKGWALWLLPEPSYAEAADCFQKACELAKDPAQKAQFLIKVADSQFRNGQHMLAADTYGSLIKEYPASVLVPQARFQAAECRARAGKSAEAETMFREIVDRKPADMFAENAMLRLAELKESRGDLLAALAGYEQFAATFTNSPLYPNALHGHGLISYRLLRFDKALDDFEQMVRLAPQGELAEQAYYMRGWCRQMLGREQLALATCTEFVRKYPASKWAPDVMFWIGEYEFNRGDFGQAETGFMELATKFPAHPLAESALLWAGKSAAKRKEYLRANEHFQELVKRFPAGAKVAEARYSQGDALSELGKFSNAILIFEEVIANYDSYVVDLAWGRKGDCEFALGGTEPVRYESAMDSYGVVVNSATASEEIKLQARYKIGRCLQKLGRNEEAFNQYYLQVVVPYLDDKSRGLGHNPASEVWFTQAAFDAAGILESGKKWTEAVKLLKRVADAGVAASEQARERINEIRRKNWLLFY